MAGLIRALLTIFLSLILGIIAIALCAYYFPETLESIQIWASYRKDDILYSLTNHFGTTPRVNVWLRFLLQEQSLVFMAFVVVARIIVFSALTFVGWLFSSALSVEQQYEESEAMREAREHLAAERRSIAAERERLEAERKELLAQRRADAAGGAAAGSLGKLG
ncbi:MAG: hypothetical protein GC150_00305 [Rhizobiales bacterium]|nr:hypothetical protein [Hyphomicrobiales bacterium]